MKNILVLVEGQTEERFIKDVLAPHLWSRGKHPIPSVITTKRVKSGNDFTGGFTGYGKVENDLRRLLQDTAAVSVTTFIDYYALPSDFPGMDSRPVDNPLGRVRHVEATWRKHVDHPRFRPYLMVHEFEALLFSKPDELCNALSQPQKLDKFKAIRDEFASPEDINDSPITAPSKRIIGIIPAYQKVVYGALVSKRIGLEVLRNECPHFSEWLGWLESL
ncbi:MAG: DUF4276 family protein [Nitrospirae bacterium]|nr:DUF4276 family protein [Nitrospirota bacterium]